MAQFVAGQALGVLTERTALRKLADSLIPGRDDERDLLTARPSSTCSAGATSTSWRAPRGG